MDRKWDNNMTVDELKQEVMTSLTVEELDELRRTIILKITRDKDSIKGSEQLKQFVEKYEEYFSRDNNEIIIPINNSVNLKLLRFFFDSNVWDDVFIWNFEDYEFIVNNDNRDFKLFINKIVDHSSPNDIRAMFWNEIEANEELHEYIENKISATREIIKEIKQFAKENNVILHEMVNMIRECWKFQ